MYRYIRRCISFDASSALSLKFIGFVTSNVELITYNQEQFNALDKIIDDIMFNFINYYYVAGENYVEHPYYQVELVSGEVMKDYQENYYDNNPLFNISYQKLSYTSTKLSFSIRDKNKCLEALQEYYLCYGCDCVYNDECNVLTCEAQDKRFITQTVLSNATY